MRNFIAAVLLAAFAPTLAYADESYEPAQIEQESAETEESSAAGESTGEEETESQAPRELDV
jgi:hypothetical protein